MEITANNKLTNYTMMRISITSTAATVKKLWTFENEMMMIMMMIFVFFKQKIFKYFMARKEEKFNSFLIVAIENTLTHYIRSNE